ncbi:PPE domain-containing protein [Kitasatospora sp. NPDC094028]
MGYTNFHDFSHADLRKMAQALDPGAVMAAGDPWHKAAAALKDIRQRLNRFSGEAIDSWEGATSDAFHARMLDLANKINTAAAYAQDAGNALHDMSEAMAKAKRDMPEEPGWWDQRKDDVGGLFSDDDHIRVVDRKKAEAVEVMQTLAMHYRVSTTALKVPPPLGTQGKYDDVRDAGSQADPSGAAAAAAAVVSSAGATGTPMRAERSPAPQRSTPPVASKAKTVAARSASVPTDSGIKGGTAQAPPKPSGSGSRVPAAGISGTPVSTPTGSVPSPATAGTQTSVLSTTQAVTPGTGPFGGGGGQEVRPTAPTAPTTVSPVVPITGQGKVVGPGGRELPDGAPPVEGTGPREGRAVGGGTGTGGGGRGAAAAKPGGGPPGRPGGVVGEPVRPGEPRGKQAFTEGGSGLGARNRPAGAPGVGVPGGVPHGMPMSEGQRRRKGAGKDGKRPDYLVEDEETWASDQPANPNVVK